MVRERVLHAYVEAFNDGDWDRIVELFTPDAEIRGVLGWGGLDVALPIWRELHDYMNMQLSIDDLIIDESKAALLLKETGEFSGPFRGLAGHEPTGRRYEILAIEWFDFEGDLIRRRWAARDSGAITRQVLA
jgi:predicted ester cyclase